MNPDMVAEQTTLLEVKSKVISVLQKLYRNDAILFERNNRKGLCERALVFRFWLYLPRAFPDYFVDCDFNSHSRDGRTFSGKPIPNRDGTTTDRFVDIIVHKRGLSGLDSDFICFEIKKWNNTNTKAAEKDQNNLRILTSEYGYKYGFYLILGRSLNSTQWAIYGRNGYFEPKRAVL